jgi:DNA-binding FadR family transcriptional regulator
LLERSTKIAKRLKKEDLSMEPVRKIAVHELVVSRLRRAIHLGDFLPGDRLPAERDIATRLEVSRESVREAIRVLEAEGSVASRRGAAGGHAVTALSEPVARNMARLRPNFKQIVQLMEFRHATECLAARRAAERRSADDLECLARAVEALKTAGEIPRFRKADANFHLAVAVAARNPYAERAIVDAREAIFLLHGKRDYALVLHTTIAAHRDIFEAIAARDPERAEAAMGHHIDVALEEIRFALSDEAESLSLR